jgi:hypothetical protein
MGVDFNQQWEQKTFKENLVELILLSGATQ